MRVEKYPLLVKATRLKAVAAFGNSHQQSKVARFGRAFAAVALTFVALGAGAPVAHAQRSLSDGGGTVGGGGGTVGDDGGTVGGGGGPTTPTPTPPPPTPPPPTSSGGQWKIVSAKATRSGTAYTWDGSKNMMVNWALDANNGAYTDRDILAPPSDPAYPAAVFGGSGAMVGGSAKQGQTAKASQDFDVTVKIQWVPGYGKNLQTDPAPDKVSLLVRSRVGIFSQSAAAPDFKISNGLDSPTKEVQPSAGEGGPRIFESKDAVLVPVSVSGAQGEVTLKLHGNGAVTAPSLSDGGDAAIYLEASFSALPDKRTLAISRVGARGPIYKDGDSNLNKDRDEWVEANGTGHGHTTYSYNYQSITTSFMRSYYNWQHFQANASNWAPDATVTWSPSDDSDTSSGDTKLQHKQDMIFGSPYLLIDPADKWGLSSRWEGDLTGLGKSSVSCTITDNSTGTPVTATANYKLTLHDEWELGPPAPTDQDINPCLGKPIPISIGWEPANTGVADKPLTFQVDTSTTTTLTNTVSIEGSSTLSGEASGSLPALKKKGIDATGKIEASVTVKDIHELTEEEKKTISLSDPYTIVLKPGETAHPVKWVRSHHQEFQLWHFTGAGYEGEYHAIVDTYNDLQNSQKPVIFGWSPPGNVGTTSPTSTPTTP
jgi:hypothetical protein